MNKVSWICESCRRQKATLRVTFPASPGVASASFKICGRCCLHTEVDNRDAIVSSPVTTPPSPGAAFNPPISCSYRNECLGQHHIRRAQDQEITNLKLKVEIADETVAKMTATEFAHTEGSQLSRERETVKALQATDVIQRHSVEHLEEENAFLRKFLVSQGFVLTEVMQTHFDAAPKAKTTGDPAIGFGWGASFA